HTSPLAPPAPPPTPPSASQTLPNINPAHIQPRRVEAGEPAPRAREINTRPPPPAPVTLHINNHPSAAATTAAPTPLRNRQRKPSEQHMLDAAMERRRHPCQQRLRQRNRQRQREPTRRPHRVARRIERAINQRQRGCAQLLTPKRNLATPPCILRPPLNPFPPPPKPAPP